MTSPRTKEWVSKKRQRNFIAKKLREDRQYLPKVREVRRDNFDKAKLRRLDPRLLQDLDES